MTKKGKRNLILEFKEKQFGIKELEKVIYVGLKEAGIKYAEDVIIYLNTKESIAYCVSGDKNVEIKL